MFNFINGRHTDGSVDEWMDRWTTGDPTLVWPIMRWTHVRTDNHSCNSLAFFGEISNRRIQKERRYLDIDLLKVINKIGQNQRMRHTKYVSKYG